MKISKPVSHVTAFATIILIAASLCAQPAPAKDSKASANQKASVAPQWVTGTVMIKAPVAEVWRTIHEERSRDPDLCYSKVIEQVSPTEYKLEQKFNFLPIIGTSVCLMNEKEVPNQRIEYSLVHSDRFKAMEGSWVLTPCEDGRTTKLELSSRLDLGLPVPRSFMNGATGKKIQKRLNNVKEMAERSTQVAASHHPAE